MYRQIYIRYHMNFDIALQKYYKSLNKPTIKLDYNKLFRNVCTQISNVDFLKGFIFVPKPDEFLMKDSTFHMFYLLEFPSLSRFLDANRNSHGSAYHRVVTHTDQTHQCPSPVTPPTRPDSSIR